MSLNVGPLECSGPVQKEEKADSTSQDKRELSKGLGAMSQFWLSGVAMGSPGTVSRLKLGCK